MRKRILLMYITVRSGHYQAARAIEQAIRRRQPSAEILTIDAFQYLNPILARIVDRLYLSVIQKLPELWDYLYDNPDVVRESQKYRQLLHRYDSPRLQALLNEFKPEVIACTQAFPCGLVADYKQENGMKAHPVPLIGVVTDFTPHAYWVHDQVDYFIVPSEKTGQWLKDRKVPAQKVQALGIPIDPVFKEGMDAQAVRRRLQISPDLPVVLLMGGGQGLGPILESVKRLDKVHRPFQLLAVAGSNESLYHRLIKSAPGMRHPMQVFGHVDFVSELMSVASLIVTKPGGLTSSEALAKGLPIVALDPIPGQEVKNANFLVEEGAACMADRAEDLPHIVEQLLGNPQEIQKMAANARRLGRPNSAEDAARLILGA